MYSLIIINLSVICWLFGFLIGISMNMNKFEEHRKETKPIVNEWYSKNGIVWRGTSNIYEGRNDGNNISYKTI